MSRAKTRTLLEARDELSSRADKLEKYGLFMGPGAKAKAAAIRAYLDGAELTDAQEALLRERRMIKGGNKPSKTATLLEQAGTEPYYTGY